MIPLYILGVLQRFGPQHGYQIKKIIAGQLADFTQIKLPTIYYHLKRMAEGGLLSAGAGSDGRPEKTVYAVTEKGLEAFRSMLAELLRFEYRPTFPSDGVFYFAEQFRTADIAAQLRVYIGRLQKQLAGIERHRSETLVFVPREHQAAVRILFSHHEHHYRAELAWAEEALGSLPEKE